MERVPAAELAPAAEQAPAVVLSGKERPAEVVLEAVCRKAQAALPAVKG
ncbi:MAG TPA: hypothetical protein VGD96_08010 [Bradyrhizobium sp.]